MRTFSMHKYGTELLSLIRSFNLLGRPRGFICMCIMKSGDIDDNITSYDLMSCQHKLPYYAYYASAIKYFIICIIWMKRFFSVILASGI